MRLQRVAGAAAFVVIAGSCELSPLLTTCDDLGSCDCPAPRRGPDGACCPPWFAYGASGCAPRDFVLPTMGDAIGQPGAQSVRVALDSAARGIAVWQVAGTNEAHLQSADESSPGAWVLREPAAKLSRNSALGDLVTGNDGTAVIAWQQALGDAGAVYVSERDANGVWTDPPGDSAALSFPPTAGQPRLATNRAGEWLLVWNQYLTTPDYGVALARRPSPSDPWQGPASADDVLSLRILFSDTPVPALDDAGQALITWSQSVGGPLMAFASERSGPEAPFTHPGKASFLSAAGGAVDSDDIKPAIAADGSAAVAWTQDDGQGATLVYLATRDALGRWTGPESLDQAFSGAVGHARSVVLAFGPKGDLYLAWSQDEGPGDAVLAARRRPDGTWAEDGRHAVQLSTPGAIALSPALAVGPDGGVVVAWQETAGTGHARVAARRTGRDGEVWGPVETLSPEDGTDATSPAAAVGPGDRAIVAWTQGEATAARVLMARVE